MSVSRADRAQRLMIALLIVATVLGGALVGVPPSHAVAAEVWTLAASPAQARAQPTATLLLDGRVLLVGNPGALPGDAELYTPAPDQGGWTRADFAVGSFYGHTATRLANGQVLVTGGRESPASVPTAVRYDPAANSSVPTAAMSVARQEHTATLLADGRVLVTGGRYTESQSDANTAYDSTERYDQGTNRWTAAAALGFARTGHTATLLPDGQVLVAGGGAEAAERYDPRTDRWGPAGTMSTNRYGHTATLLPDGRVLVVGGDTFRVNTAEFLATAELYDPRTNAWGSAVSLAAARGTHTATLLPNGQVLVVGGAGGAGPVAGAERYDPATNRWEAAGELGVPRFAHAAVVLLNGQVLVAGGRVGQSLTETTRAVEVYSTGVPAQCFTETDRCMQGEFLTYWGQNGGLAINGYPISGEFRERLEDGSEYTVQYFERVRLERHPENQPPYDILLGQFGRRLHPADPPVPAEPGYTYFPETGHNVGPRFGAYWRDNGGLTQFGLPLSEPIEERLENGMVYTVQYFERARFELHPENSAPNDILLGQFGRRIYAERLGRR